AGRGDARAVRLQKEVQKPRRLLATLLLANNIANYAGSLGIAAILNTFWSDPVIVVVLNTLLVVPLLFVFGETLPKDLFRTRADTWAYRMAGPLVWVRWLFTAVGLVPFLVLVGRVGAWAFGGSSGLDLGPRARMTQLLRESVQSGGLTSDQVSLADRILSMEHMTVSTEMTRWAGVVSVKGEDGRKGLDAAAGRTRRSRLPVVGSDGKVQGTISVMQTLLHPNGTVEELLQPVPELPGDTPVLEALEQLRRDGEPMAIVVRSDGSGLPAGLVTLKDLVEPLTGDLAAW
ncbi:MAG: CNNM domain-containing protein, partial [Phycisphaerales bacterium]|nr:CNNM domain-containing protein [Phycisphaerales bacterium]